MSESSDSTALRRTSRVRKEPKYRLGDIGLTNPSGSTSQSASSKASGVNSGAGFSSQSASSAASGGSAGKSRRTAAYKRHPRPRPPASTAAASVGFSTLVTTNWLFHADQYYQVGDIVSLVDAEDSQRYFAQIRGLLQDQFLEKSCVLTWLIPTQQAPDQRDFHPGTYILGPEEDLPRPIDSVEFVCHCPSDYFARCSAPYPSAEEAGAAVTKGFVWTSLGHESAWFRKSHAASLAVEEPKRPSPASAAGGGAEPVADAGDELKTEPVGNDA